MSGKRTSWTVTFETLHSTITTTIAYDADGDPDYAIAAAEELVCEELGIGGEIAWTGATAENSGEEA